MTKKKYPKAWFAKRIERSYKDRFSITELQKTWTTERNKSVIDKIILPKTMPDVLSHTGLPKLMFEYGWLEGWNSHLKECRKEGILPKNDKD